MSHQQRAVQAQLLNKSNDDRRLSPQRGMLAGHHGRIPGTRAVHRHHPAARGQFVDQSIEITQISAEAMHQYHSRPCPSIEIVQSCTIDFNEAARWRRQGLRPPRSQRREEHEAHDQ